MTLSGCQPTLSVLYVPDYTPAQTRINATMHLTKVLENIFPQYRVSLAVATGPFEDIEGTSAHFDGDSLKGKTKAKQVAAIRNDYQVKIASLARNVSYHAPKLVVGHGQGGLISLGFGRPYLLELALQTRNVQRAEAPVSYTHLRAHET